MQDQHTGKAGKFFTDPEGGIRYPEADADIFNADPSAYRSDPEAARKALAAKADKPAKLQKPAEKGAD